MTLSHPSTPQQSSPARRAFEDATRQQNIARVASIGLDTTIEATIDTYTKDSVHTGEHIDTLLDSLALPREATDDRTIDSFGSADSWIDVCRYIAGSTFSVERVVMPLTIDRPGSHMQRQKVANGILGKTLDLVAPAMEFVELHETSLAQLHDDFARQVQQVRGWIQEMTVMALINYPQSADSIALPSSTIQDLEQSTDLVYYWRKRGAAYLVPVSVKSSLHNLKNEEKRRPHLCVVSAAEINNLGLSITRLLLRQYAGHPGIDKDEEAMIDAARSVVMRKISAWLEQASREPGSAQGSPVALHLGRTAHTAQRDSMI